MGGLRRICLIGGVTTGHFEAWMRMPEGVRLEWSQPLLGQGKDMLYSMLDCELCLLKQICWSAEAGIRDLNQVLVDVSTDARVRDISPFN